MNYITLKTDAHCALALYGFLEIVDICTFIIALSNTVEPLLHHQLM